MLKEKCCPDWHTVAVWEFHYFVLSCNPSNREHFRCNKQSLMQPELWFSVCKSYKDILCWKGNVVWGVFQLTFLFSMFTFSHKWILLLYATSLFFSLPLQIVNYVLYFCKSSEMFTTYSCFLSLLFYWEVYIYIYEHGGRKNEGWWVPS